MPSESTFSRFLETLSNSESLEQIFHDLVIKAKELDIIDGEHISIDSTKLDSFEAAKPKKDIVHDGTNPNWGGMKKIPMATTYDGLVGNSIFFVTPKVSCH